MSERSSAASHGTGEEAGPPVDVPAGIREERRERDETTPGALSHPFERREVSDQGSPRGRGAEDLPGGASEEDPADPTSPVHPDR
jgi:hypothetical protein